MLMTWLFKMPPGDGPDAMEAPNPAVLEDDVAANRALARRLRASTSPAEREFGGAHVVRPLWRRQAPRRARVGSR